MPKPFRLREMAQEHEGPLEVAILRKLNKGQSIEAAAPLLKLSSRRLYDWCKNQRVQKTTVETIGGNDRVVIYSIPGLDTDGGNHAAV